MKIVITGMSACLKSSILDRFRESKYRILYSDSKIVHDSRIKGYLDYSYDKRMYGRYMSIKSIESIARDENVIIERSLIDQLSYCKMAVEGPWDILCDPNSIDVINNEQKYLSMEKDLDIDKYYFLYMESKTFIDEVCSTAEFKNSDRVDCYHDFDGYIKMEEDYLRKYYTYIQMMQLTDRFELVELPLDLTKLTAYKASNDVFMKIQSNLINKINN